LVPEAALRDIFARSDISGTDKLLVCLAVDPDLAIEVRDIRTRAVAHGLRAAKDWNVSSMLSRASGMASRVAAGWILTGEGRKHLGSLGIGGATAVVSHASAALRVHAAKISSSDTAAFVDEAIRCFEAHLFRAAVVLSWVGSVSLLYDHVMRSTLTVFNAEAQRRNTKHRHAVTKDDLARMKESEFLDCLEGCSVIGKSVRKELGVCLDLRNGCGHPNSLKLAEARVASHIEVLILNVFTKF
jgi:hypothetical protein